MYYVCEMCVCLIQLTDSDHLLCPYFQKSTDSKNKQKKSRAKLTVSHMSGSFHVVLKAVILQEKSAEVSRQGGGSAVAGVLMNLTNVARKGPYIHLNVTFRTKKNVFKA